MRNPCFGWCNLSNDFSKSYLGSKMNTFSVRILISKKFVSIYCISTHYTVITFSITEGAWNISRFYNYLILTFGGKAFKIFGLAWLLIANPADAKFRFAGSESVVRFHLRGESPPFSITRCDIPKIPLAGLPYLKNIRRKKIIFWNRKLRKKFLTIQYSVLIMA